jgi:hypothetical protein
VLLLVLLGGGENVFALSVSLLLPGIALILYPPKQGLGRFFDRAVLVFLGVLLLGFLPQFYWPDPEWRKAASDLLKMDLGWMLSVRPMMSFEAWLSVCAGIAWFYAARSWPINYNGRKWFYVSVSVAMCLLAGAVVQGILSGVLYPAAEHATRFSFFPAYEHTATFLAIGGVVTFGFAMSNLRAKQFAPFIGFFASALCLAALVAGQARPGLFMFFIGIAVCFLFQLKLGQGTRGLKIGFPLVLFTMIVVVLANLPERPGVQSGIFADEPRAAAYSDTWSMIQDAPLSGYGLGTFDAIFPQYRDASVSHESLMHPQSSFLWLASEGGLLALLAFGVCLGAYFRKCRGLSDGNSGLYRGIAFVGVGLFLLYALIDVSARFPGMVYFMILLAVCALPKMKQKAVARPLFWRMGGVLLVIFGLIWFFAGVFSLPLHSKIAMERYEAQAEDSLADEDIESGVTAVQKWLDWQPMNWRAHFQHGNLLLAGEGAYGDPRLDFERARFVEPTQGEVTFQEGLAWLPHDVGRTLDAWQVTLARELEDRDQTFALMLREADENRELFEGLARISEINPHFRSSFLNHQEGIRLMEELNRELAEDPALLGFDREQRTSILRNWILRGDTDSAEGFLQENEDAVDRSWWLWSLVRKNQARFDQAVAQIRTNIEPAKVPYVEVEDLRIESLVREFTVTPTDTRKGAALMQIYIAAGDYDNLFEVADAMTRAQAVVPPYVLYWRAECLYQFRDFIESWYTFEAYLERIWGVDEPML